MVDLSDPTNPIQVRSYSVQVSSPGRCVIFGNHLFAAHYSHGLDVRSLFFDDRSVLTAVAQSLAVDGADDMIGSARITSVQTNTASWSLSADGGANWQTFTPGDDWTEFDVAGSDLVWRADLLWDSPNPPEVTDLTIEWQTSATGVDVLASQYTVVRLQGSAPNPTRSGTVISYELPRAGLTEILIYDVEGRRVRSLEKGVREAGAHRVHWDGRTDDGMLAASGVYFYQLRTGNERLTKKVVLTR